MRLKKKELKQLIESLMFEEDVGSGSMKKLEDTAYGKAAKQVAVTPDGEMITYIFPDPEGNAPDAYETPDGGKYYYGKGEAMKEAMVTTKENNVFIYHPENKPAGIE